MEKCPDVPEEVFGLLRRECAPSSIVTIKHGQAPSDGPFHRGVQGLIGLQQVTQTSTRQLKNAGMR